MNPPTSFLLFVMFALPVVWALCAWWFARVPLADSWLDELDCPPGLSNGDLGFLALLGAVVFVFGLASWSPEFLNTLIEVVDDCPEVTAVFAGAAGFVLLFWFVSVLLGFVRRFIRS